MHFDKTSPKKRNPQQQKISRNATKKTAQLCGKTAQLATLMRTWREVRNFAWHRMIPSVVNWYIYIPNLNIWYNFKLLGIKIFDLVHMTNLVYIWNIFVGGFSLDFKPVYLVYYKAKTEKPIAVLKLYKNFQVFCLTWEYACTFGERKARLEELRCSEKSSDASESFSSSQSHKPFESESSQGHLNYFRVESQELSSHVESLVCKLESMSS